MPLGLAKIRPVPHGFRVGAPNVLPALTPTPTLVGHGSLLAPALPHRPAQQGRMARLRLGTRRVAPNCSRCRLPSARRQMLDPARADLSIAMIGSAARCSEPRYRRVAQQRSPARPTGSEPTWRPLLASDACGRFPRPRQPLDSPPHELRLRSFADRRGVVPSSGVDRRKLLIHRQRDQRSIGCHSLLRTRMTRLVVTTTNPHWRIGNWRRASWPRADVGSASTVRRRSRQHVVLPVPSIFSGRIQPWAA